MPTTFALRGLDSRRLSQRETILRPMIRLAWALGGATVVAASAGAHLYVQVVFASLVGVPVAVWAWATIYLVKNDRDSMRSEGYLIARLREETLGRIAAKATDEESRAGQLTLFECSEGQTRRAA